MVVKILNGAAFGGLVRYMTHDAPERDSKPRTTTERVAWSRCENLPTGDPEMAIRVMASTVRDADYLKAAGGVSARGRKLQKPVKHIVISWPAGAEPSENEQLEATSALLTELGLEDRQRVTVAHDDRDHRHVHICVNRVSHVDGRTAPARNERLTASTWAERFERERRQRIECPARVENRQRREDPEREEKAIRTAPKRRRRDTGELVDPLPGETALWAAHYKVWKNIPKNDPSARRTRRELARDLEAVREYAGPAPGATLERRPTPLYSRAEIDAEERRRTEQARADVLELQEILARDRQAQLDEKQAAVARLEQQAAQARLEEEQAERRKPAAVPPTRSGGRPAAAQDMVARDRQEDEEHAAAPAAEETPAAPAAATRPCGQPAAAQDIDAREQALQATSDARVQETLERIQREYEAQWGPDPEPETAPARRPRRPPAAAETPTAAAETPTAPVARRVMDKVLNLFGRQRPSAAPAAATRPRGQPAAAEDIDTRDRVAAPGPKPPLATPPDPYSAPILLDRGGDANKPGGADPAQVHEDRERQKRGRTG